MDDKQVRKIVKEEMFKSEKKRRFGVQNIPLHTHNGEDAQKIPSENILKNPSVMGRVIFSSTGDYTFDLNMPQTPSLVTLNGNFFDNVDAPTVRYSVWGQAVLGPAYYLQPGSDRSVVVGGIPYPAPDNLNDGSEATIPAQSSTFFGYVDGAAGATAGDSQFHIVNVFGSATMRMTVIEFSKNKIVFRVTSLSSGYDLAANFLIT